MIPQSHQDTGNREDLQIKPNSCFSDLKYSVESTESRMRLHVGKTQLVVTGEIQQETQSFKDTTTLFLKIFTWHIKIVPCTCCSDFGLGNVIFFIKFLIETRYKQFL